jgi:hypothetical protein
MKAKTIKTVFILSLLGVFSIPQLHAQVSIGTTEVPAAGALLQVKEKTGVADDGANAYHGVSLPRVTLTDKGNLYPMFLLDETNPASGPNADYSANKATLDKTHTGLVVYNTGGTILPKGLACWTGTVWEELSVVEPWQISGSDSIARLNTQNIYQAGKVAIGYDTLDASAILNVYSTSKGVLLPRVTLTANDDQVTVPSPTVGLLVYNTGTDTNFKTQGYMYWGGYEWKLFNASTSTSAKIVHLNCLGATLSPSNYQTGVPYEGVIKVPYTGGNGGFFTGGTLYTANGLTFTLQDGKLDVGAGELVIRVEGTPTVSSPVATIVPINTDPLNPLPSFLELNIWNDFCEIKVGDQVTADIKNIAVMDYMHLVHDDALSGSVWGYAVECTTPDGLYTIRVFFKHSNQTGGATETNNTNNMGGSRDNVQLRNNSNVAQNIMWNYVTDYGSAMMGTAGDVMTVPPKVWGGSNGDTGTSWRSQTASVDAAWGNADIYNALNDGPEYRRYTWIDTSTSTKVAYNVTIMAGKDSSTPNNAIWLQKVFIKIEQITAL